MFFFEKSAKTRLKETCAMERIDGPELNTTITRELGIR